MNTINFELSKRLNDLGLLNNIETEYGYEYDNEIKNYDINYYLPFNKNIICKTLTLEEAIEFLGDKYFMQISGGGFNKNIYNICIIIKTNNIQGEGETLLEAIEKIIEYLLDNNLLGQK